MLKYQLNVCIEREREGDREKVRELFVHTLLTLAVNSKFPTRLP
jgi:hypothetical protein